MVGPKAATTTKKKRATEVAQNALRAHYTQKDLRLTLMRILPDKKSKPCKKQNHEANCQHSGDHHVIEKHDVPPALALLR
jgi:ribosomal protein L44E